MSISVKFPFKETTAGGLFMANETTQESIQTNLISLLTLKRRSRVMHNNLFSPLWDYIFEPWDSISETLLKSEIIEKIGDFIPQVEVSEVLFSFVEKENLLEVKVVYKINDLGGVRDSVSIIIPVEPGESSVDVHV